MPTEALFARGIDPETGIGKPPTSPGRRGRPSAKSGPSSTADRRVIDVTNADIDGIPASFRRSGFAILEHEEMYQETLLYMLHRLPHGVDRAHGLSGTPRGWPQTGGRDPCRSGHARADRGKLAFTWDTECPGIAAGIVLRRAPRCHQRAVHGVVEGGYAMRGGGLTTTGWLQSDQRQHPSFWEFDGQNWFWRALFERVPLPPSWPVFVTLAEASAFSRWRGARLMTEAEFQRAAYGSPVGERVHPWGNQDPEPSRGAFDFTSFDPVPAGSHPAGTSAWGVEDLVGNGWEWTASAFDPFQISRSPSYPGISGLFFTDRHFVMKGASPVTARELLRPTFRNWFRPRYPYVYATFRCVKSN
jgi:hypothetical protein